MISSTRALQHRMQRQSNFTMLPNGKKPHKLLLMSHVNTPNYQNLIFSVFINNQLVSINTVSKSLGYFRFVNLNSYLNFNLIVHLLKNLNGIPRDRESLDILKRQFKLLIFHLATNKVH